MWLGGSRRHGGENFTESRLNPLGGTIESAFISVLTSLHNFRYTTNVPIVALLGAGLGVRHRPSG